MGFSPTESDRNDEATDDHPRLDPETIERIEYALEGTIDVDVSALSPDDKLTLLIERYNRKTKDLREFRETQDQY